MKQFSFALGTAVLTLLSAAPQAAAETMSGMAMDHAAMTGASQEYEDAMAAMNKAMAGMGMTGEPGRDFVAMMIPHHQAAIDMAQSYLKSGDTDPLLTKMSRDIIAAQEREIGILKAWLAQHGG